MSRERVTERPNSNFERLCTLSAYVQDAYDSCKDEALQMEIQKVLNEINGIFSFVEDNDEMPEGKSLDVLEANAYQVCSYPIEFRQGVIPEQSELIEMLTGQKQLKESYERSLQLIYAEYINLINLYRNSKYVNSDDRNQFQELYESVSTRMREGELEGIADDLNELQNLLNKLISAIRKPS